MMKDDELWLKKIKERLDDYSEPLPDTGWERLEKVLPASAPMSVGKKKQIMFRRWAMTAAAVVLVAVSSVSLWLLQSPVVDEVRRAAEPALATIPDVLPEQTKPDTQGEQPEPVIRRVIEQGDSRYQTLVAQHLETESNVQEVNVNRQEEIVNSDLNSNVTEETGKTEQAKETETSSSIPEKKEREVYRPSGRDKLHLPTEKKSSTGNKGWAVGMSVGNTGALATLDNAMVACSQVRIQLLCLVINWIYRMFPVVFWIFLKDRNWYLKVEYLICGKIPVRLKISSISNLLVSAYRYEKHCRKTFLWKPV